MLMPRNLVIDAWKERFGNTSRRPYGHKNRITLPGYVSDEIAAALQSFECQSEDQVINELVRPFAQKFLVSIVVIRIRLQRLGLLRREVPRQRTLAVGV